MRKPNDHSRHHLRRRTVLGAGWAAGLGIMLTACDSPATGGTPAAAGEEPVTGGTLRVGLAGGGATDTLDAHIPVNATDIARSNNLYEALLYRDDDYVLQPRLALSAEPNDDATVWTIVLREDVRFHDGRTMTSDDVRASFERIIDPEDPKSGAASLDVLDRVEAVDDTTVKFHLTEPLSNFDDQLGQYNAAIVPADYDPAAPVGTGPFRYDSFTPGQRSLFVRHEEYWVPEQPYLDELEIINFDDSDALLNALLSAQVDAIGQVPLGLLNVLEADPRIEINNSETGSWLPFTMRVDRAPFDDVRVRQAMRLAVDREEMVRQVLSGNGVVGNDVYARYDPLSADIPQRTQDVEEAKRLLADAGYPDGIDVELVTAPVQAGAVEAAQVFAEQASRSGIRVTLRQVEVTTFYGEDYLQWDFAQDFWYTRNFTAQASAGSLPDSPFNQTHFDDDEFTDLILRARGTVDEDDRADLIRQAQEVEHARGGYIIWGFANQADAYQGYVGGLVPNRTGLPLSGLEFRRMWTEREGA